MSDVPLIFNTNHSFYTVVLVDDALYILQIQDNIISLHFFHFSFFTSYPAYISFLPHMFGYSHYLLSQKVSLHQKFKTTFSFVSLVYMPTESKSTRCKASLEVKWTCNLKVLSLSFVRIMISLRNKSYLNRKLDNIHIQ